MPRCRILAFLGLLLYLPTFAQEAPRQVIASRVTIAPASEPGDRLKLTATLYDRDGKPLPNHVLFAYHTDIDGIYAKPVNDSRKPRLRAWVKTDAQGRFELDTIKPGSYPEGGNPAHIHVVFMENGREAGADECWFEGDRFLSENHKQREAAAGGFPALCV
ncbi:MAG TPA: hypothetical protein VM009_02825 [Terriglobales bacterium]|nr:hypothetical protein [Terriglobales bacterium]